MEGKTVSEYFFFLLLARLCCQTTPICQSQAMLGQPRQDCSDSLRRLPSTGLHHHRQLQPLLPLPLPLPRRPPSVCRLLSQ